MVGDIRVMGTVVTDGKPVVGDIRVMGVVVGDGKPKEIQEKLDKLAKLGVKLFSISDVAFDDPRVLERIGPIWPIPFPGEPIPFSARRVFEREGFIDNFFKRRDLAPVARFKVDPDIRGGIRNFHVHLGNEVVILDAQTFEHLVRAAADELHERGEGNTITW